MANNYFKKCSTSLAIREMKMKINLKFYFTSARVPTIKKKNGKEHMESTTFILCCLEFIATMETSVEHFQNNVK